MKLIITIDTEEDNWACYSTTDNTVENIEKIVPLQALFDRFGVKPTYLVTYPVATNLRSVSILKAILDAGKCEIGTHCHPWNTPPFEEEISERNSMLCNLPEDLVYRKLKCLHEVISNNFGMLPVSFRAGRWGFGVSVARSLVRLGYRVDSSVTPFTDWTVYQGPDFSGYQLEPYRFDPAKSQVPNPSGVMMQVPATIGFLQNDFELCHRLSKYFSTGLYKKLHFNGVLHRLGILNKVWLSPEQAGIESMINLANLMMEKKYSYVNLSFHSTTLKYGLSPFAVNMNDETNFLKKIEKFLVFSFNAGIESRTLNQVGS